MKKRTSKKKAQAPTPVALFSGLAYAVTKAGASGGVLAFQLQKLTIKDGIVSAVEAGQPDLRHIILERLHDDLLADA